MNKEVEQFNNVANELCKLHEEKNASYGNAFTNVLREFGDKGIYHATGQMYAKMERIKQMVKNDDLNTFGESIDDAIKDLVCYGIMTLAMRKEIAENRKNQPRIGDRYKCVRPTFGFTVGKAYIIIDSSNDRVWIEDDADYKIGVVMQIFTTNFKQCKKEKQ